MGIAAALGAGLQLVGGVVSYSSQQSMIAKQTAASKRAENSREQQMQLDAQRRRRQAVREGLLARSMAVSAGANQGASYGSGVAAGVGTAIAAGLENQQGVNSGQILGSRIFQANRDYFEATQQGQFGMALGQGISALGGAIASNAGAITRLGTNASSGGPQAPTQTFGNTPPLPRPRPYTPPPGFGYAGNGG